MLQAFVGLLHTHGYEAITVRDIVGRAAVSRSSFYAHFTGKHDLFAQSVSGPFEILAQCVRPTAQPRLTPLLEHFWSNRRSARSLLLGALRQRAATVLVREIEAQLDTSHTRGHGKSQFPRRLLAWQVAEAMLGLVTAWLTGEARCAASEIANALQVGTQSLLTLRGQPSILPSRRAPRA